MASTHERVQRLRSSLQGAVVTTVTPFTQDAEHVDEQALRRVVRHLVDAGIRALIPCGNTGEFHSLTTEEWRQVVSTVVDEAAGRAVVIAAVGGSVRDAVDGARFAREANADGVMILPMHHTYSTRDGIREYYQRVLDTDIAAIAYLRGRTTFADIAPLIEHPNLVGGKWAETDVAQFANVRVETADADFTWSCGLAEQWAPMFWLAGAKGFTSGLGNFAPRVAIRLYRALADGDWVAATAIRDAIAPFERFRAMHDGGYNVGAVKYGMRAVGIEGGPVRPPLSAIADSDMEALEAALRSVLNVDPNVSAAATL